MSIKSCLRGLLDHREALEKMLWPNKEVLKLKDPSGRLKIVEEVIQALNLWQFTQKELASDVKKASPLLSFFLRLRQAVFNRLLEKATNDLECLIEAIISLETRQLDAKKKDYNQLFDKKTPVSVRIKALQEFLHRSDREEALREYQKRDRVLKELETLLVSRKIVQPTGKLYVFEQSSGAKLMAQIISSDNDQHTQLSLSVQFRDGLPKPITPDLTNRQFDEQIKVVKILLKDHSEPSPSAA